MSIDRSRKYYNSLQPLASKSIEENIEKFYRERDLSRKDIVNLVRESANLSGWDSKYNSYYYRKKLYDRVEQFYKNVATGRQSAADKRIEARIIETTGASRITSAARETLSGIQEGDIISQANYWDYKDNLRGLMADDSRRDYSVIVEIGGKVFKFKNLDDALLKYGNVSRLFKGGREGERGDETMGSGAIMEMTVDDDNEAFYISFDE